MDSINVMFMGVGYWDAQAAKKVRPKTFMRKLRKDTLMAEHLSGENVFPTIGAALAAIATRTDSQLSELSGSGSYGSFYEERETGKTRAEAETDSNTDGKIGSETGNDKATSQSDRDSAVGTNEAPGQSG